MLEVARRDVLEPMERGKGVLVAAAGDLEFGLGEEHRELRLRGRFVGFAEVAVAAFVAAEKLRRTGGKKIVDEGGLGVTGGAGETTLGAGVAAFGKLDEAAHKLHAGHAPTAFGPDVGKPASASEERREERPEQQEHTSGREPEKDSRRQPGLDERPAHTHGDVAVRVHPEEQRQDDRGREENQEPKERLHVRTSARSAAARARRSGASDGGRGGGGRATRRARASVACERAGSLVP